MVFKVFLGSPSLPRRLAIGAKFVHALFIELSAKFDEFGDSRHTKLSPTYELSVLRYLRLIFLYSLLRGMIFYTGQADNSNLLFPEGSVTCSTESIRVVPSENRR